MWSKTRQIYLKINQDIWDLVNSVLTSDLYEGMIHEFVPKTVLEKQHKLEPRKEGKNDANAMWKNAAQLRPANS